MYERTKIRLNQLNDLFKPIIDSLSECIHTIFDASDVGFETGNFTLQPRIICAQLCDVSFEYTHVALHALDLLAKKSKIDLLVGHA